MSVQVTMKFDNAAFAECLESLSGQIESEAQKIAARANGLITKGGGFAVEMSNEPRFLDASYGVTRPVARVYALDDVTSAEEAENKILSKAVGK